MISGAEDAIEAAMAAMNIAWNWKAVQHSQTIFIIEKKTIIIAQSYKKYFSHSKPHQKEKMLKQNFLFLWCTFLMIQCFSVTEAQYIPVPCTSCSGICKCVNGYQTCAVPGKYPVNTASGLSCVDCPNNYGCPLGNYGPTPCPAGYWSDWTFAWQCMICKSWIAPLPAGGCTTQCMVGTFPSEDRTKCDPCKPGYSCPLQTSKGTFLAQVACLGGRYTNDDTFNGIFVYNTSTTGNQQICQVIFYISPC